MSKRISCVICENNKFTDCFTIINSISYISKDLEGDYKNETHNLNFIGCLNCGCVQLYNLFDPNEIYQQASHYTCSDVWKRHNNLFSKFISENNVDINSILEVGGGSGVLANLIKKEISTINKYNILDISTEYIDTVNNIDYIKGNCETFNFNNVDFNTLVFSHVFEHLYEPIKFIKNLRNCINIKNVYISNPHMEKLIKNNDYNCLNIQHTYYVDTNYMIYLFKQCNFKLNNSYNFENNSVFYHFVKEENVIDDKSIEQFKNISLVLFLKNFYYNLQNKIQNIIINKPFFICPSGFYGQIVYHYLNENTKNNIIGFLDSDKHKINMRLSGTNCIIYNKNYIENMENVEILIIADKYKDEITSELNMFNNKINMHLLH
jgi:ubiquinone/menaquinone biosynthesis C-methylase UbiE